MPLEVEITIHLTKTPGLFRVETKRDGVSTERIMSNPEKESHLQEMSTTAREEGFRLKIHHPLLGWDHDALAAAIR